MGEISNEEMIEIIDFYKQLGLSQDAYISSGKIIDIFSLLKIKPEYDENGRRKPTCYEIIGIPPRFDENGNEVPIFLFIKRSKRKPKNRLEIIEKFTFKKKEHKKIDPIIEMYKREYETAIAQGNLLQADIAFDMLDKITGGKAKNYISVNFDYLKFYKAMKKQLLIDIFSHFFLLYISLKKSLIKSGIIKKGKIYRAFKDDKEKEDTEIFEKVENDLKSTMSKFGDQKVSIVSMEDGELSEMDYDGNNSSNSIDLKEQREKEIEPAVSLKEQQIVSKIKKQKRLKIFKFGTNRNKFDFKKDKYFLQEETENVEKMNVQQGEENGLSKQE